MKTTYRSEAAPEPSGPAATLSAPSQLSDGLMAGDAHPSTRPAQPRHALLLLLLAAAIVFGKDISIGGFRHGDSAVHAMDGVLIRDWVAAGPDAWRRPMQFAVEQYAHYPTLGIGRHYPPGFAVVEAGFFAVFGVSAVSARLCVLCFGLLAAAGTYLFVSRFADRWAALLAAALLLAMPAVLQWGRQVMLELPTLAVLIWAGVAFSHYARRPCWKRLGLVLIAALSAVLFKQPAVFLSGAIALTLFFGALRGEVPWRHGCCAAAVSIAVIVAAVLSLDGHGAQLLRGDATFPDRWSAAALSFYLCAIPRQVGLPVLAAALVGVVVAFRRLGFHGVFLIAWLIVCYVMLTITDYKNPRFFFPALFPFACWAGLGGGRVLASLRNTNARTALCRLAVVGCCAYALVVPVEHRPDYGVIVRAHQDKIRGCAVLFSGLRDGDFVFAVRQHLPWRQALVIRGSKLLYTCNGRPDLDFASNVSSPAALETLMRRFAFRYVFIERENKLHLPEDAMLRSFLRRSGWYRRVAACSFRMDRVPSYRDVTLEVFESAKPLTRLVGYFDLLIPRANRTVRVDLSGWS